MAVFLLYQPQLSEYSILSVRIKGFPPEVAGELDFLPEESYAVAQGSPEDEQAAVRLVLEVPPMLNDVENEHA